MSTKIANEPQSVHDPQYYRLLHFSFVLLLVFMVCSFLLINYLGQISLIVQNSEKQNSASSTQLQFLVDKDSTGCSKWVLSELERKNVRVTEFTLKKFTQLADTCKLIMLNE